MAYNKDLEVLLDKSSARWKGILKKNMFGGAGYLLYGNMCFGIWKNDLIIRCGLESYEEYLKKRSVKKFDITGKVMKGWIMVSKKEWNDPACLKSWLGIAKKFVSTLPKKTSH